MLSLEVYKYITTLAQRRGDYLLQAEMPDADAIKTFSNSRFSIHVIAGHSHCQQVLTDSTFIQPEIADAISTVMRDSPTECGSLELFLRNNPMQQDGTNHRATRQTFVREYNAAQKALEPMLEELAERSLKRCVENGDAPASIRIAAQYVDDVIGLILSKCHGLDVDHSAWSGDSSSIFEFFHAPVRLKDKGRQVSRFLTALPPDPPASEEQRIPVLLSYLLQGRDPLIGAMTAYMRWLTAATPDERIESLSKIDARQLFWRTSPVNYIGRTATRDVTLSGTLVKDGDQMILMLPWAGHSGDGTARSSMAFGGGAHVCAGQALALGIANAWLAALKRNAADLDWRTEPVEPVIAAVFRQYKGQK